MLKADGVHFNKRGSEVFGRILRGGVRAVVASQRQEAEELQLQRDLVEEEHQELRRQYGDQAGELAEFWAGRSNFPPLSCDDAGLPASSSELQENTCTVPAIGMGKGTATWAMVVQRPPRRLTRAVPRTHDCGGASASAEGAVVGCVPCTQHPPVAQSSVSSGPVTENPLPTSVVVSAPSAGGDATHKLRQRGAKSSRMPVTHAAGRAPPLVGGVWVQHKASTPGGSSVCPSSSGGSVSITSGSSKGTDSKVVVQRHDRGGANATARCVVGARVPPCTQSSAVSWSTDPLPQAAQSTDPAFHAQSGSSEWTVVRRRRRRRETPCVPLRPNHLHVKGVPMVGRSRTEAYSGGPSHGCSKKKGTCSGLSSSRAAVSDWNGMLKADGVHFNKRGSEVFGRILRGGVRAVVASQRQEAEELQLQRDLVEEEHQELRRQYGDQAAQLLDGCPSPLHPVPSRTLQISETNDEMAT
ncbi:hypothetical protein ISCGN_007705 [Ixodes scapularis]